ncbi:FAD-dependent oxidoreductase [Chelativorans sp. J32]|uniref:FAD-dependent oxidoreductase n=1 Tax=Chelativorans sp. J32 TaxID=935840 RepID=UPI0004B76E41|nr:FAD-dependent oxidoreductase [Chelativorans sp. J32]
MNKGNPFWFDGVASKDYPALAEDLTVDVAIVGGGIVGLHCAHRLSGTGLKVVLLEARRIGRQATGRSTAKVTSQHGQRYASLTKKFGDEQARIYARANQDAVAEIAALAQAMEAQAGLEPRPAYIYAVDDEQAAQLKKEYEAAKTLGLPAEIVSGAGLPFHTTALLRYDGQYQFNPYLYLVGLAERISSEIPIYEQSRVTEISAGEPIRLSVNGRTVTAAHAVVATQMPVVNEGKFFAKAYPFAHAVVAARLPDGKRVEGMFISSGTPSHSLRTAVKDGQTYLIAAGGEFKTGEPEKEREMVEDLRSFLSANFGIDEFTHLWTNEDFRPMDGAAFIGPATNSHQNLLVATGFDAWGITQGVVAGGILAERILGRSHPAADLFDSTRVKPMASAAEFTKGNIKAAGHLIGDRVMKRAAVPLDSIAPGEGGIISHKGEQLAVRRHDDGSLIGLSATCTHMGCIVGWNGIDRTWDCPCHGSRFDERGEVIAGPAVSALEPRDVRELEEGGS